VSPTLSRIRSFAEQSVLVGYMRVSKARPTAAKLRLAQAAMGRPGTKVGELCAELSITRQTLYRHVDPNGLLRPDGEKLLSRMRTRSAP
jgi:hypothetical protein